MKRAVAVGVALMTGAVLSPPAWSAAAPSITFHDIAAILRDKCAPCHRPGAQKSVTTCVPGPPSHFA